jgi:hypothetical protein
VLPLALARRQLRPSGKKTVGCGDLSPLVIIIDQDVPFETFDLLARVVGGGINSVTFRLSSWR